MKFSVTFTYENQEKIAETRASHRMYLATLKEQGKLSAAGPYMDDSGALIIYKADSEDEARQIIANDPYQTAGIVASYEIHAWRQVY